MTGYALNTVTPLRHTAPTRSSAWPGDAPCADAPTVGVWVPAAWGRQWIRLLGARTRGRCLCGHVLFLWARARGVVCSRPMVGLRWPL